MRTGSISNIPDTTNTITGVNASDSDHYTGNGTVIIDTINKMTVKLFILVFSVISFENSEKSS